MQNDAPHSAHENTVAVAIGNRIRSERTARNLTLDQLAQQSGVSRRMLVNVEHGDANPSVNTLLRISDALGIGLPQLLEPPATHPFRVTRAGEGVVAWHGDQGGTGRLLAGTNAPEVLELWHWDLPTGESYASEPHTPGTMELIYVVQGELSLAIAGESVRLSVGDSVVFASDVEHSYANTTDGSVRYTMVVFEPGVGTPLHRAALRSQREAHS